MPPSVYCIEKHSAGEQGYPLNRSAPGKQFTKSGAALAALAPIGVRLLSNLQELGNELAQAGLPRFDIG